MNDLEPKIMYEDNEVLVLSKPAGLVVNRSHTTKSQTLQDWLQEKYPYVFQVSPQTEEETQFVERVGVAHRLDKDTCGVLIVGKTPEVLAFLMKQFKDRKTQKGYLALVHGKLSPQYGQLSLPIGRDPNNRLQFNVVEDGKPSSTQYRVVHHFPKTSDYSKGFSLVALRPETGRTHQLRVVMRYLRKPIVADKLYLTPRLYQKDIQWCPRHFLHAAQLCIQTSPSTATRCFNAPLSDDLIRVLDRVKGQNV